MSARRSNDALALELERWINSYEGFEAAVVYKELVQEAIAALREPEITVTDEPDCGHENAIQRNIRAVTCPDCGACVEHWD